MACACKEKANKIQRLIPEINQQGKINKGLRYYLIKIGQVFLNILLRLLIIITVIIFAIPASIIVILQTSILKKDIKIKIPQGLIKKLQMYGEKL